jgi:hypothetical protein
MPTNKSQEDQRPAKDHVSQCENGSFPDELSDKTIAQLVNGQLEYNFIRVLKSQVLSSSRPCENS